MAKNKKKYFGGYTGIETCAFYMSATDHTLHMMPKYNGFTNGCGLHRSKKTYNRKDKAWRREVERWD